MKRRNFMKSSLGATITGATLINELFMNQLYGNAAGTIPQTDILQLDQSYPASDPGSFKIQHHCHHPE